MDRIENINPGYRVKAHVRIGAPSIEVAEPSSVNEARRQPKLKCHDQRLEVSTPAETRTERFTRANTTAAKKMRLPVFFMWTPSSKKLPGTAGELVAKQLESLRNAPTSLPTM